MQYPYGFSSNPSYPDDISSIDDDELQNYLFNHAYYEPDYLFVPRPNPAASLYFRGDIAWNAEDKLLRELMGNAIACFSAWHHPNIRNPEQHMRMMYAYQVFFGLFYRGWKSHHWAKSQVPDIVKTGPNNSDNVLRNAVSWVAKVDLKDLAKFLIFPLML